MICLIISLIIIIYAAQILIYAVHMFQQNGYKNKVHLNWIKHNYLRHFTRSLSREPAKKPLVYTPRVIRLLVTTVLCFFVLCQINRVFGNGYTLLVMAVIYTVFIVPFAPVISNIINKPVETSIANGFKKKAVGKVTYARVAKGSAKCLTVNKKNGKVIVAKGTKKGTYKVKVKVTATGNGNYKKASKTITCTVVVK